MKIPGIEFDFGGGRVYLLPPLALGHLQLLQTRLVKLDQDGALHPDTTATILEATHAALSRNYPEITREQVGELVDVGNLFDVMQAVMDVAGVKRKEADEAKKQAAQAAMTEPIGPGSSLTFAPTPDGRGTTSAAT